MKALLIKDFYTLVKQMKMFIVLILIFAILPGTSLTAFAVIYCAMLPMTAISYDENCKWDKLAVMMPYSAKSLVFEKYVFGYALIAASAVISLLSEAVLSVIRGTEFGIGSLGMIAAVICVALVMQAINLPFIYKFGVEKGRFVYLVVFVAAFALIGVAGKGNDLSGLVSIVHWNPVFLACALLVVTALLNVGSILLSERFYLKKNRN
ncbi:MAG TPA: ABC-2 transporter permease [Lachnospiraceae bacterium]|nr:ABC-2 transporter permease [Lachnospiraceae bacterium]